MCVQLCCLFYHVMCKLSFPNSIHIALLHTQCVRILTSLSTSYIVCISLKGFIFKLKTSCNVCCDNSLLATRVYFFVAHRKTMLFVIFTSSSAMPILISQVSWYGILCHHDSSNVMLTYPLSCLSHGVMLCWLGGAGDWVKYCIWTLTESRYMYI